MDKILSLLNLKFAEGYRTLIGIALFAGHLLLVELGITEPNIGEVIDVGSGVSEVIPGQCVVIEDWKGSHFPIGEDKYTKPATAGFQAVAKLDVGPVVEKGNSAAASPTVSARLQSAGWTRSQGL